VRQLCIGFFIRLGYRFLVGFLHLGNFAGATPPKSAASLAHSIPPRNYSGKGLSGVFGDSRGTKFGGPASGELIIDPETSPSILISTFAKKSRPALRGAKLPRHRGRVGRYAAHMPEIRLSSAPSSFCAHSCRGSQSPPDADFKMPIGRDTGMDVLGKSASASDYGKQLIEFGEADSAGIPVNLSTRAICQYRN